MVSVQTRPDRTAILPTGPERWTLADGEALWRVAGEILVRYRAVVQVGVQGGPGSGPIHAARAEVYREVFALLLGETLRRLPTREEIAVWLAAWPSERAITDAIAEFSPVQRPTVRDNPH